MTIAGTRVYVVAEVGITCTCNDGRLTCSGSRRPIYILILSDSERRAFTVRGEEVTREELIAEVAGIEELLDS